MIVYRNKRIWLLRKLLTLNGSVFPSAFVLAIPCSVVAGVMRWWMNEGGLSFLQAEDSILRETQAWSGFTFLVGFLIVFRTSQAYSRFWEGCTATHQMRAEWLDAVSALIAFSEYTRGRIHPEKAKMFKAKLVRLFSLLHLVALGELEVMGTDFPPYSEVAAFRYDVVDPQGLDMKSLRLVQESHSKVQLVYSWVQCAIVEGMREGVLGIPAPILSRAFQEIANGMVQFHDAMKISGIPFPFPYTQTCDALLVIHWIIAPFVTCQWVTSYVWAFIFVFIQVFVLWALNFIAIEIENPFGTDPNDLDGRTMQMEMNQHLLLLLRENSVRTPRLMPSFSRNETAEDGTFLLTSMYDVWGGTATQAIFEVAGSNKSWGEAVQEKAELIPRLLKRLKTGIAFNPQPERFYKQKPDPPLSPNSPQVGAKGLAEVQKDETDQWRSISQGLESRPFPRTPECDSHAVQGTSESKQFGLAGRDVRYGEDEREDVAPIPALAGILRPGYVSDKEDATEAQLLLETIEGLAELLRRRCNTEAEWGSDGERSELSKTRGQQGRKDGVGVSTEPEAHHVSQSLQPKLLEEQGKNIDITLSEKFSL